MKTKKDMQSQFCKGAGGFSALLAGALFALTILLLPLSVRAAGTQEMYRLYNAATGEHLYTASTNERDTLVSWGWRYEGIAWTAPESSNTPVYRLYNPNSGDHHYTTNAGERDALVAAGWGDEGIGWYSDDAQGVPLYRLYNPNAATGSHHYTTDAGERDALVAAGWKDEGTGWYGAAGAAGTNGGSDTIGASGWGNESGAGGNSGSSNANEQAETGSAQTGGIDMAALDAEIEAYMQSDEYKAWLEAELAAEDERAGNVGPANGAGLLHQEPIIIDFN